MSFDIRYRTLTERPRAGAYGSLMRAMSAHPLIAGLIGGLLAIGIALARGWKGASTLPEVAAIICLLVLAVWVGLFWMMRGFFGSQTREQVEVVRRLTYEDDVLVWHDGEAERARIERPVWRLLRAPHASGEDDKPACVYIIAAGAQQEFVLETRVLWSEASELASQECTPHEVLPAHVASPLLELARASA